ncbi:MAG TPA: helix-turn-helix domain-containing protein [Sphingopyxis sp.]|nr:helix-turn-helix domain-containing protein [Sphingopyxis sp.]HMP43865.1 helix-turn-helix domain-containing protein [Sphingopyxis sp.]HMQ20069.1 helix-turn-helix domain-containing protein [Sphingopyxis sp.]
MSEKNFPLPPLPAGVAAKAGAVVTALRAGSRDIADVARATGLPRTTVVRVAALLRDAGVIRAARKAERVEVFLAGES